MENYVQNQLLNLNYTDALVEYSVADVLTRGRPCFLSYFNNFKIYFPDLEAFKALFNDLIEIYSVWDAFPNGLSSRVMAMLGSEDSRNSFTNISNSSSSSFDNFVKSI